MKFKLFYPNKQRSLECIWKSSGMACYIRVIMIISLLLIQEACRKLIEVKAPVTAITSDNVYVSDATATAALTGIYLRMSLENINFSDGGFTSMSLFPALSADELTLYNLSNTTLRSYYSNTLTTSSNPEGTDFWYNIYTIIFIANSAIEGLNKATGLTPAVKQQLTGEAKFIRAFCYFYLVNLYGDVPLAINTDYKINALLARTSKDKVWQQIITDLKDAQELLNTNYVDASMVNNTIERTRPNKWAATALLARAYLYTGDYAGAEEQSTAVINNSALYNLIALNDVFLKNSMEAIWQLQPVGPGENANTGEGKLFVLPTEGPNTNTHPVYLSNGLVNDFETGDQRKINWTDSVVVGSNTYYYPYKYKIGSVISDIKEYVMVLRLGEQYLVRAEAKIQQGKIQDAVGDLNTLRARARGSLPGALPDLSASISKEQAITAVMHERQIELFTEWGHRWLDLKRTNTVDIIMSEVTPQKGGSWNTNWQWYPIPLTDLQRNPNLVQNDGYN